MKTKRKTFYIEKLLKEHKWSKSWLARYMWITHQAVNQFFNSWAITMWTRIKYSQAFNECFWCDFSENKLFSLVD